MKAADKLSYKEFLKNYYLHIAISDKSKNEVASLLLEAKTIPLTFQGNPLKTLYLQTFRNFFILK